MYRVTGIALSTLCLAGALWAQQEPPTAPPGKALVIVRVQADAVVIIDGRTTKQTGAERKFVTPVLEPGATYRFEIVARWKEMDQERTATRMVDFQADQVKVVDLTKSDVLPKKVEPKKEPAKKVEPPPKNTEPERKKEAPAKKAEPEPKKEAPAKKAEPEPKKEPLAKKAEPEKKTQPEKKTELAKKVEPMPPPSPAPAPAPRSVRSRSFLFTYAARVKDVPPGAKARIWIPIATSNAQQEVTIVEKILGEAHFAPDPLYGNTIAYFESEKKNGGVIPFEITYKVRRKEVHTDPAHGIYVAAAPGEPLQRYLQPDAKVPLTGKSLKLLAEHAGNVPLPSEPVAAARLMFAAVQKHVTYKPAAPGAGQGDADWACENGIGSCVDLHSVFIAMARGHRIPAKLEVGFALPAKPGPVADSRSWAWFSPDAKGWVSVDIPAGQFGSLDENRVSFSVGRDIELVPRQNGAPLNFFIDPYVEVNGKAYPQAKIQRRYSFKDAP